MKVKILAFGIARDILGSGDHVMDIPDNITIIETKNILTKKFPGFEQLRKFSIAINEEYRDDDFVISDQDELVIIPPVSGG